MGRKPNEIVWGNFNKLSKGVQCKHCKKQYVVGNVNKMHDHLLACLQIPADMRKIVRELREKKQFDDEHSKNSSASTSANETDVEGNSSCSQHSSIATSTPKSKRSTLFNFLDNITDDESVSLNFGIC